MASKRSNPRGSRKNLPAAEHVNHAAPVDQASVDAAAPLPPSELARIRGVSRQAVHRATRAGGPLEGAKLPDGSIDASHEAVIAWLARGAPGDDDDAAADPLDGDDPDLTALVARVAEWRALKLSSEAKLAARRDAVHAGRLVSAELVRTHVFGLIEGLHVRLLTDAASTMAQRARTSGSLEDAVAAIRDHLGSQLAATKAQAIRALRAARTADNPPALTEPERLAKRERVNHRLRGALDEAMRSKGGPRALDLVLRSFARHAAGKPWTAAVFNDALSLRPEVERDVLGAVVSVLIELGADAIREADRALEAQHQTEEAANATAA